MSHRGAAFALAGVAMFLVVATLLPPTVADHSYAHRYVIFGRLVDSEGHPVPQMTMNLAARLFSPEGACRDTTGSDLATDAYGPTIYDPVTDAFGDFTFCFHTHIINRVEPGEGTIKIEDIPSFEPFVFEFDPYVRQQFVLIKLKEPHENANGGILDTSYTVVGRLWREASARSQRVDGIEVYGDTLIQTPVNIELVAPDGTVVANTTSRTNDYGDFAVRLPTSSRFSAGQVRLSAAGENFSAPATSEGVTAFSARYAAPQSDTLFTALKVGAWIVLGVAVIGGGYYGITKMTERRELDQARQTTTRKRANK